MLCMTRMRWRRSCSWVLGLHKLHRPSHRERSCAACLPSRRLRQPVQSRRTRYLLLVQTGGGRHTVQSNNPSLTCLSPRPSLCPRIQLQLLLTAGDLVVKWSCSSGMTCVDSSSTHCVDCRRNLLVNTLKTHHTRTYVRPLSVKTGWRLGLGLAFHRCKGHIFTDKGQLVVLPGRFVKLFIPSVSPGLGCLSTSK